MPIVHVKKNGATGGFSVSMTMTSKQVARWYLMQAHTGGVWGSRLVPSCTCNEEIVPNGEGQLPDRLVVTAIDRAGMVSGAVRLSLAH
jgi:hypothetical protein